MLQCPKCSKQEMNVHLMLEHGMPKEEADKYDGLTKTEAKFQDILDKLGININLGKGS